MHIDCNFGGDKSGDKSAIDHSSGVTGDNNVGDTGSGENAGDGNVGWASSRGSGTVTGFIGEPMHIVQHACCNLSHVVSETALEVALQTYHKVTSRGPSAIIVLSGWQ